MPDFVTSSQFYPPSSCNVKICDDSTSECASDAGKSIQMEEETPRYVRHGRFSYTLSIYCQGFFFIFLFVIYETLGRCKHKSQWNTIHYVYLNEFQTPFFDKRKTVLAATPKLSNSDLIYISI